MTTLETIIRLEIESNGPITFARFMEIALYHPEFGYYTGYRRSERIGRKGDFFTSVSVGSIFGELLCCLFSEMWENMGRPEQFTLVEVGAHQGQLSEDVVQWAAKSNPAFHAALRPTAVDYPGHLPERITGCVFSNELLDSFPVHRIKRESGEWKELFVSWRNSAFTWQTNPLSSAELAERIQSLPLPEIEGYTTEIHLETSRWVDSVARSLDRGFLLTIDYGFAAADYYASHRSEGTLLAYYRHQTSKDLLARAGEQDLTAHVNFTSVINEGAKRGLKLHGFTDQSRFIAGILGTHEAAFVSPSNPAKMAQLKTLLHPEMMGRVFKVLIQERGMSGTAVSGLKFSRDYIF